ncbi:hypothetical protein NB689_002283 [Xanthomonas sacchari]|nr:hypothetical protein [Xanthomonas sacchari]
MKSKSRTPALAASANHGSTFSGWAMCSITLGLIDERAPASRTAWMPALNSLALRVQSIGRRLSQGWLSIRSELLSLPTCTSSGISPARSSALSVS